MKTSSKPTFRLLIVAFALHCVIWLALFVIKFSSLRRWILLNMKREIDSRNSVHQCSRAVKRTSRLIPGTTCLSNALCGYALLLYNGHTPKLILGIEKGENQKLDAHAWIEVDGEVLIGDNGNLHKYETLKNRKARKAKT